jgi:hypothetical protein
VSWHTVRRQFYRDLNDDPELALNYARANELDADRSFERIEEAVRRVRELVEPKATSFLVGRDQSLRNTGRTGRNR